MYFIFVLALSPSPTLSQSLTHSFVRSACQCCQNTLVLRHEIKEEKTTATTTNTTATATMSHDFRLSVRLLLPTELFLSPFSPSLSLCIPHPPQFAFCAFVFFCFFFFFVLRGSPSSPYAYYYYFYDCLSVSLSVYL